MEDNIIKHSKGVAIINGGNPLNDCPTDWEWAENWAEGANKNSEGIDWNWDCGFKLDYDGPILRVSSRFYPPKTHYGKTWDGNVSIYLFDNEILKKEFDCPTLEDLKKEVESFVSHYIKVVKSRMS